MNKFFTGFKASFVLGGIFLFSDLASAERFRSTTLPAFCKSLFPKLVPGEGRVLSQTEIEELLRFAQLSPQSMIEAMSRLGIPKARSFLEKMLLLRSQVRQLPLSEIPPEHVPTPSEITSLFPKSNNNESLFNRNQESLLKRVLEHRLDEGLNKLATSLAAQSSPTEKLDTFNYFLSRLDAFDASWFHQTKLDSLIDLASGIQTKRISSDIQKQSRKEFNEKHQGEETYSFAGPELLLTPYTEILNIFQGLGLKPGDRVVDLGAGFGRLGLAIAARHPGVSITGYEIVRERIAEGARVAKEWGLQDRVHLFEQNLADPQFHPEAGDVYFAFNPVSGATFDKILEDLRQVGLKSGKRFRFVLFGPSPFEKADAQPWLRELDSPNLPKGEDLKIYEFVPERATHTEIILPERENPFELKNSHPTVPEFPKAVPFDPRTMSLNTENESSFLSPKYFGAWAQSVPFQISQVGTLSVIHSFSGTGDQKKEVFLEPRGGSAQEKAEVIEQILKDRKARGAKAEFTHLSPEVAKILSSRSQIETELDADSSDFIYQLKDLVELNSTKRLRDRNKQVEQFRSAFPSATITSPPKTTQKDENAFDTEVEKFLADWAKQKLENYEGSESEKLDLIAETQAAQILRTTLTGTSSIQIALRLSPKGPIIAYASGEVRPGPQGKRVLHVYVQKSDGTKNAIPFLNQALAQEVFFHPEKYGQVDLMNMMDASNPGLKQFKKQYGPDPSLGQVYRATFRTDAP